MSTYNCRGAINGIIVQNNPVNFIDPDGLRGILLPRSSFVRSSPKRLFPRHVPQSARRINPKKNPNPNDPNKFCPRDARPGEKGQPPEGEDFLNDIAKPIDTPWWFKAFEFIRALVPSAPPVDYWAGSPDA